MRILMNCFDFLKKSFEPFLPEDTLDYFWLAEGNSYPLKDPKMERRRQSRFNFVYDFLAFRKRLRSGAFDSYDVIHINNWFNFLLIKYKQPHQVWVAHSHGIHLGLNDKIALSQSKGIKRLLGEFFFPLLSKLLIRSIRKFDLYFVSIPNAQQYAWLIRKDAVWLPNPIEPRWFTRPKETKIEGRPAVFLASRLHPIKNPVFAFHLFDRIQEKYPDAKLHLITYGRKYAQEDKYASLIRRHHNAIIWHDWMSQESLASLYASTDLVLGAFYPKDYYANLNLVELEAMATGGCVVAHDAYEYIKRPLRDLPGLALSLLESKHARTAYVKASRAYVKDVHGPKQVALNYRKELEKAFRRISQSPSSG